ncbi:MAG: ribosome recycling factor [Enterobacteriaceae bacterium]
MQKILVSFDIKISKIFTSKASTKILDNIIIKYNGVFISLNKLANITLYNYNTIKINLFDFSLINTVKNSIIKSNLNLSVFIVKKDILVILPQINEKRRKELIKIVHCEAEKSRISIRIIRRKTNLKIKNLIKKKKINIDEKKESEKKIQKITDICIKEINLKLIKKEKKLINI